ncbi:hypothetical protein [Mesorhizobium denitrificans]|uniref:Uncharacterized protein n=1 Tax=Mesorhizobium denitrificans TaxID=2294114 RepID=A0A371XK88_9HYPH|nr:hypothetical protein [Mesorhizobium denitrificans]RFC69619.1 hypothetical protein DY251_02535 [Mesorhizobium denitrificans]
MPVRNAANDNAKPVPLHIALAVIDTFECIWRVLYSGRRGSIANFDSYRDRRAIQRMREKTYRSGL